MKRIWCRASILHHKNMLQRRSQWKTNKPFFLFHNNRYLHLQATRSSVVTMTRRPAFPKQIGVFNFAQRRFAQGRGNPYANTYITRGSVWGGLSFGSCLAMIVSYHRYQDILWAIIHGIFSWIYVVYFIMFLSGGHYDYHDKQIEDMRRHIDYLTDEVQRLKNSRRK